MSGTEPAHKASLQGSDGEDIAAIAKGGRTNLLGFPLRLIARIPFLFIAGRLYGEEALGLFASALVMIEFFSLLASMGQKRGLARRLTDGDTTPVNAVTDAMVITLIIGSILSLILFIFPYPMFPSGQFSGWDRLLPFAIIPVALTDVALAALAYHFDVKTSVRARSVVEPWTISIAAGVFFYIVPEGGLALSYIASVLAAALVAAIPFFRHYGWPKGWRFDPGLLWYLVRSNAPLSFAELIEWGTRRLDIALLGFFASPAVVGIYYVAQQVASLPQKLKTSFEPVLGPVITRSLKKNDYKAIAKQVSQVGFWIVAAQAGIALALGIPGTGIMGLVGPGFVDGTPALLFLLAAEVVAATAVVSEAALIYMARMRNLLISIGTIVVQALLTVAAMLLVDHFGLSDLYRGAGAACALMVSLGLASVVKARVLAGLLNEPINNFRLTLLWAALPAGLVGWAMVKFLPEWAGLLFGLPAILGIYCWIIWTKGFGPEDRVLFLSKRKKVPEVAASADE